VSDAEERPAFYALSPGGARDYWTLLHPPYTLWHLSYVAIGAALAPIIDVRWLLETLLAFLLALGLAAHAFDELAGRPLRTRISGPTLWTIGIASLAAAVALGIDAAIERSAWILVFVAVGTFLVLAYNLEVLGGAFHSDLWFALGWGAFPALTAYFAQTGRVSIAAVLAAAACAAISSAQRALSSQVRRLRRSVERVTGELILADGSREAIVPATLGAAHERALRRLSVAMPLLAAALLIIRWP
jgi:hypothetical protein